MLYLSNATYLKGVSLNDCLNTKYAMIKRDIKEMETQTILKTYSLHKLAKPLQFELISGNSNITRLIFGINKFCHFLLSISRL